MNYQPGNFVVPLTKTSGHREFNASATFYKMVEMNQKFLHVVAVDEEGTKVKGKPCYWCNTDGGKGWGDSYAESDLIPYQE